MSVMIDLDELIVWLESAQKYYNDPDNYDPGSIDILEAVINDVHLYKQIWYCF